MSIAVKLKACRQCKTIFTPLRPLQFVCSPICALQIGRDKTVKKALKAAAADRKVTAQKLYAMQTKPQLVKKAQTAFNGFIRARDAGKPCISCSVLLTLGGVGGGFDCGHYRSVGSAVHMRFVQDNAHGQCKQCNRHLAGNHVAYRAGLIERIGIDRVEQIERDQTLRRYSHENLREVARIYRLWTKEIKG